MSTLRVKWSLFNVPKEKRPEVLPKMKEAGFEVDPNGNDWQSGEFFIDIAELDSLNDFIEYIEIKPLPKVRFSKALPKLTGLPIESIRDLAKDVYQVTFSNGFLHEVKEVEVLEDGCTIELQKRLEDGWRILAVCPQLEQRRPDYVLGRIKT